MSKRNGNESYIFFDKDTAFSGDVKTDHLVLEGMIKGDVRATKKVYLKSGSVVHGEIATRKCLVEDGSIHDGKLRLNDYHKNSVRDMGGERTRPNASSASGPPEADSDSEITESDQRLW